MRTLTRFLLIIAAAGAAVGAASCAAPVMPQGWAMVYGISDYGGGGYAPDLKFTDDDARSIAELLEAKGWNVRLRIDSEATLAQLTADAAAIAAVAKSTDRILFYYSGHGVYLNIDNTEPSSAADSYDEVLLLYNSISTVQSFAQGNLSADVLSVTVTDDTLAVLLASIPAVSRMIILDNCYSGGFIGDGFTLDTTAADYTKYEYSTVFKPAEALQLYLGYSPTTYDMPQSSFSVMAASGESEESYESSLISHGYFTYYLLQSPAGADYNFDGFVSFSEAYKYTAASIDANVNSGSTTYDFLPHVVAFPVDPVLFTAD